jgi:predicted AlkP superfamily pyrophosphatase or phosphodiesterase
MATPAPLVLINAVGLTRRLLGHAPRLKKLAERGWARTLSEAVPAVTCTAQATILTGEWPNQHGIVANGWLYRDTREVRFWQQANSLLQAEPFYATARRRAAERGRSFKSAKLFWWFNQGAAVDLSVTPKPFYGADGNKAFGVSSDPPHLATKLEANHGRFPFHTFWGPSAGLPCTAWIGLATASILESERPDLTLAYLPHLDYDPQRLGPSGADMPRLVRELDDACEPILDMAKNIGARIWVVSEYGHVDTPRSVELNRVLRSAGLLVARPGPFGEQLETFQSRAFAVCDHQLAHVYVRDAADEQLVRDLLARTSGVARVLHADERVELYLDHPRSGELIALADPDAWFAYPFWLDDASAPDYARTVDIHRKPGYDPNELFFDPSLRFPKARVIRRLLQKKLGFRTLFDVIPLRPMARGSHGLAAVDSDDGALLIADGPAATDGPLAMTSVRDLVLQALELAD